MSKFDFQTKVNHDGWRE